MKFENFEPHVLKISWNALKYEESSVFIIRNIHSQLLNYYIQNI